MFYAVSKIFWFFAEPSNLIGFALAVGVLGLATSHARAARGLLTATTLLYLFCGFGPAAGILMRPLEDRFPRPPADMAAPDGVIVLGGGMEPDISEARNALVLGDFGSRMTEGVALARRYPTARLIFTGGGGDPDKGEVTEAEIARRFFLAMGVAPERLVLEDRSRNTYENAIFTRDILKPRADERFLLVTSGFHTPRSMGVFRRAGYNVIAWPADYTSGGKGRDFWRFSLAAGHALNFVDYGTKEWIGLVFYRIAGMTDALLPGPAAP